MRLSSRRHPFFLDSRIRFGLTIATFALGADPLAAEPDRTTNDATQLDAVQVTATREPGYRVTNAQLGPLGELPLLGTPYSINVIGNPLLQKQQAATYGDDLKNDPSASFGNVPVGFASLRGFSIGTDCYLYDGLVGNQGLSDGRYQIEGIDRIEVLKRSSAVLYGVGASSSVGGVLNLEGRNYWAGAQNGLLTLAEPRTLKASARTEF